jgi:hypothetical protein
MGAWWFSEPVWTIVNSTVESDLGLPPDLHLSDHLTGLKMRMLLSQKVKLSSEMMAVNDGVSCEIFPSI